MQRFFSVDATVLRGSSPPQCYYLKAPLSHTYTVGVFTVTKKRVQVIIIIQQSIILVVLNEQPMILYEKLF